MRNPKLAAQETIKKAIEKNYKFVYVAKASLPLNYEEEYDAEINRLITEDPSLKPILDDYIIKMDKLFNGEEEG